MDSENISKLKLTSVRSYWFGALVIINILLTVALWKVGQTFGDPKIATNANLGAATGFVVLNLALAIWAVSREPFASSILLIATMVSELTIIIFLWLG